MDRLRLEAGRGKRRRHPEMLSPELRPQRWELRRGDGQERQNGYFISVEGKGK